MHKSTGSLICMMTVLCAVPVVFLATQLIAQVGSIDVGKMRSIGTVDERFQSYNIEMVEVIGGRFWKPYGSTTNQSKAQEPATQEGSTPAGTDPNLYQYRKPIDLSNPRLRKLSSALGPAYVRVSGTWVGLRKPPIQPVEETPGRRLFWIPSDILFNMQASPSVA